VTKGRQRSAKWYFQNEKEVMQELGFTPTKGSGSSWIEKEDGENDYVLAQLKSTDYSSYKLTQLDLEKLEHNALIAHKIPLFVLQFLNNDTRYAIMAIEDIPKVAEYIKTGATEKPSEMVITITEDKPKKPAAPKIKSSSKARDQFYKQKDKEWEQRKWKQ
jgi:hypothetical protein